jgi:peptide/nickel transport system permease protein
MGAFVIKRLLSTILILAALILIMLVLSKMSPITPGRVALGPKASADAIAMYDEKVGFNDPLPVRFIHYVGDLVAGDLGISARTQRSVSGDVVALWPATLELAAYGMLAAILLGLLLGGRP